MAVNVQTAFSKLRQHTVHRYERFKETRCLRHQVNMLIRNHGITNKKHNVNRLIY